MKFETVRIYFLSEFTVCCHVANMATWRNDFSSVIPRILIYTEEPSDTSNTEVSVTVESNHKPIVFFQLQDNFGSDVAPQSNRLADRLRFLRNARTKRAADRLPEEERETVAETEGS